MTSKEFIQEQIKKIKNILKDNENVFSKEMKSLYEDDLKHYNQVLKDLEEKEYYEKIKLMLKQKESALRYIESEDCFAVRCILDENWYKLTDDLIKNNIKEEVKPMPLIDKVKKQDKILDILKDKIIIHCENNVLTITSGLKNQTIEKLVNDNEEKIIKEWLDNAK